MGEVVPGSLAMTICSSTSSELDLLRKIRSGVSAGIVSTGLKATRANTTSQIKTSIFN